MGQYGIAAPKGETRKQVKARETRAARAIVQQVRAACVARDGYCRLAGVLMAGPCFGRSEWAHMPDWRRSKTVGQPADQRHCVQGTVMLCTRHHELLDRHHMQLEPLTEHGAESTLRLRVGWVTVLSVPRSH